jgi:hypothetical protein
MLGHQVLDPHMLKLMLVGLSPFAGIPTATVSSFVRRLAKIASDMCMRTAAAMGYLGIGFLYSKHDSYEDYECMHTKNT